MQKQNICIYAKYHINKYAQNTHKYAKPKGINMHFQNMHYMLEYAKGKYAIICKFKYA